MISPTPLLQARDVTKQYGRVTVLDRCQLDVAAGEVHALLGANGAGKSTFVRIFSGLVSPTAAELSLAGNSYAPRTKREAEEAGIQIVQQELNLIPTLSVAENLMLTRLPATGGILNRKALDKQARIALDRFGLEDIPLHVPAGSLGVGRQQMVEIAGALDRECRLLILDEPTAALSAGESEALFQQIEKLKQRGIGIVYISHRLEEISRMADRATVLRDGRHVGTYKVADLTSEDMVRLMSGDATPDHRPDQRKSRSQSAVALRVKNVSCGMVRDVSFEVQAGEKLGVAGLVGAGRTELLRAIFGADRADSGTVQIQDRPARLFSHPAEAVAAGLAMLTEDRKQNGLFLSQSIRANSTLASLWKRFSRAGLLLQGQERKAAAEQCERMQTRCTCVEQLVGTLSGGNQQKVAVAKWLIRDADVFLLDEPTRGIDVAARRRIHELIDTLADAGKGIVLVSSDVEELLETCDRIAVMSNGQLIKTFTPEEWSRDAIMDAAFAGYMNRRSS